MLNEFCVLQKVLIHVQPMMYHHHQYHVYRIVLSQIHVDRIHFVILVPMQAQLFVVRKEVCSVCVQID